MDKEQRKKLQQQYSERTVMGGVYAIKNTGSGKLLLLSTLDMPGSKNRYNFAKQTGGCVHPLLNNEWGKAEFTFEVIEELKKKDDQTEKEFAQEVQALLELTVERYAPDDLY